MTEVYSQTCAEVEEKNASGAQKERSPRLTARRPDKCLAACENGERKMLCRLRKWLFVLHELISLCHAVIELAVAIHINLCLDRLLQALQKRLYGLHEGDIGAC